MRRWASLSCTISLEGRCWANEPELARTMATSVKRRIAFERAGQTVRRMGSGCGYAGDLLALTGPCCASAHGFSLHANIQVPAHRRHQLECLMRYTARGAVALERLEEDAHGDLVYTFTKPWSDGTTGITLSPLELLERLAALVPLPRVHLVRYGGCLAPHWSWARLLKRMFALDMAICPSCHRGALRLIAVMTQGKVIRTIRRPLKLAADPPPLAPARARQATCDWVA